MKVLCWTQARWGHDHSCPEKPVPSALSPCQQRLFSQYPIYTFPDAAASCSLSLTTGHYRAKISACSSHEEAAEVCSTSTQLIWQFRCESCADIWSTAFSQTAISAPLVLSKGETCTKILLTTAFRNMQQPLPSGQGKWRHGTSSRTISPNRSCGHPAKNAHHHGDILQGPIL